MKAILHNLLFRQRDIRFGTFDERRTFVQHDSLIDVICPAVSCEKQLSAVSLQASTDRFDRQ